MGKGEMKSLEIPDKKTPVEDYMILSKPIGLILTITILSQNLRIYPKISQIPLSLH